MGARGGSIETGVPEGQEGRSGRDRGVVSGPRAAGNQSGRPRRPCLGHTFTLATMSIDVSSSRQILAAGLDDLRAFIALAFTDARRQQPS